MPAFGLNYCIVHFPKLETDRRSDNKAITNNGYDVAQVVTTGTQGYSKAEEKLCLQWTDCWLVCGLND